MRINQPCSPLFFPKKKNKKETVDGVKKMEAVPEELKGVCI